MGQNQPPLKRAVENVGSTGQSQVSVGEGGEGEQGISKGWVEEPWPLDGLGEWDREENAGILTVTGVWVLWVWWES